MQIDGTDIQASAPAPAAELAGEKLKATSSRPAAKPAAAADAAQKSDCSAAQPAESGQDVRELASMQALVNSIKGDFAEMGLVPPPRNYAGVSLVANSELAQASKQDSTAGSGTLDRLRLLMVKGILSRLTGKAALAESAEATPPPDETSQLDLAV